MTFGKALALVVMLAPAAALAEQPDRAKLDQARSLVAEAAQLEQQRAQARVSGAYTAAISEDLRAGLVRLKGEPGIGDAARAALAAMDRRDLAALAAIRDRLVQQERALGRAG